MAAFVARGVIGIAVEKGKVARTCAYGVRSIQGGKSVRRSWLRMSEDPTASTLAKEDETSLRAPMSSTSSLDRTVHTPAEAEADWKVKLLYDGECPICMKEVVFLMKKDAGRGLIKFVDIAAEDYNAAENANVSWSRAMGKLHAILPDNSIVTGVKVFQKTYDIIGLGWLFSATKLPVIGNIADGAYDVWAKYRLRITGRRDVEELIAQKEREAQALLDEEDCEERCQAEYDDDIEPADLGL